jgi:hypothetical protein
VTLFFQEYEIKVLGEKVNGMDLELELKADACVVLEGNLRTVEEEMQKEREGLKSELESLRLEESDVLSAARPDTQPKCLTCRLPFLGQRAASED